MTQLRIRSAVLLLVTLVLLVGLLPNIQASPSDFPVQVHDDYGRTVVVPAEPHRIVSLAPSNTETLFAIGVGDRVVGVTTSDDFPSEVVQKIGSGTLTTIGGYDTPNLEAIVSLQPDLVVASSQSLQQNIVQSLSNLNFTVLGIDPKSLSGVLGSIRLIGQATGAQAQADIVASNMQTEIDAITADLSVTSKRPRVYYEIFNEPIFTVGPNNWINDMISVAGGVNIFSDASSEFPTVDSEAIIQRNPDVILLPLGAYHDTDRGALVSRPGWTAIDAVKNNRVYSIDENLVFKPGPRLVQGLRIMAQDIHPEIFGTPGSVKLTLATNPVLPNIHFIIDGQDFQTPNNGSLTVELAAGSHTVQLVDTSVTSNSNKYSFVGWTGTFSSSSNPIQIDLTSQASLTATYSTCLIATAAFDSPLAPQVQNLREFRDYTVMTTLPGREFMQAFNLVYYSFSPQIAAFISQHESAKQATRLFLYPMLQILSFAQLVYSAQPFRADMSIIISGLVASWLIGTVYLGIPVSTLAILVKRLPKTSTRTYLAMSSFLCGLVLLDVLANALGIQFIVLVSSVLLVLLTIGISATVTANSIQRILSKASNPRSRRWTLGWAWLTLETRPSYVASVT